MIPKTLKDLQQIDRELEGLWSRRKVLDKEFVEIRKRQDAAIAARFAELSDEQIMTDDVIRAWALANETYESGTYKRMRNLAKATVPEVVVHNCDGRKGFENLLCPTVLLEKDSEIAGVTMGLTLWAKVWLMGRPDLPIKVMESELSEYGSYEIRWNLDTGVAVLNRNRYTEVFKGDLYDTLKYVAEHYPYNHGRSMRDEDY